MSEIVSLVGTGCRGETVEVACRPMYTRCVAELTNTRAGPRQHDFPAHGGGANRRTSSPLVKDVQDRVHHEVERGLILAEAIEVKRVVLPEMRERGGGAVVPRYAKGVRRGRYIGLDNGEVESTDIAIAV